MELDTNTCCLIINGQYYPTFREVQQLAKEVTRQRSELSALRAHNQQVLISAQA